MKGYLKHIILVLISVSFLSTSCFQNATAQDRDVKKPIAFLSVLPYNESGKEIRAAFDFLKKAYPSSGFITFREVRNRPSILEKYGTLWFHKPDTLLFPDDLTARKVTGSISSHVKNGDNLLLTLEAMRYLLPLGLETETPADSLKSCIDEGYGRKLGLHAFLDHPVFDSLFGGAYILRPVTDSAFRITGYFGQKMPSRGKVIATDWDYIFIRDHSKLMLEYEYGKGKVVAIGAYTCFSEPNYNRAHLEMFMKNIFRYLYGDFDRSKVHYWDYEENIVSELKLKEREMPQAEAFLPASKAWEFPDDPMTLVKRYASADFFDVAGERLLSMGPESGGIEEIWAHPFMALRDYKVGVIFGYRDTVYWLNDERPEIEVRPEGFIRTYRFPRAYIKEVIANDPESPEGVIHYEYRGVYEARLIVQFSTRLRLMWPYPDFVTGSINYFADTVRHTVIFRDKTQDLCVVAGSNTSPVQCLAGQYSGFRYDKSSKSFSGIATSDFLASGLMIFPMKMNSNLDFVYAASNEGLKATSETFGRALNDPQGILLRSRKHVRDLLDNKMMITTPDPDFNLGYRWAMLATDRFLVRTPGMGRSLVAGYSTTRSGWDGAQKISGRPGYGWYFGRDGQWSGMALLDYGDYRAVKDELEFYQKYQDLSGKIFHEATTSGVIHYDAADATPLYIVLAGKYFRYTNDTAFIRMSWPHIRQAIDFCFSTDTDHDHLIENTNVGHGWVEGGELYGSHATLYMQGCWSAALEEAHTMASALFLPVADKYERESALVKSIINTDFWDSKTQFFSYGMNRNGSFRTEPTVLPAVPLYFRIAARDKAQKVLDQYEGNAFSTNWGTRIIRDDSPLFNPRGYHYGSVWPLFTGWTSLAEFAYENYSQGYTHLMDNLDIYKHWGLGFVEEVLNGAEYRPSGVCPHQCWSETMVLQPAIEGLLGIDVNAHERKITLSPHFPADWDSVTIENIRCGDKLFDLKMKRSKDKYVFVFHPRNDGRIDIEFLPSFPCGTSFSLMTLNGITIPFSSFRDSKGSSILVSMPFSTDAVLEMSYTGGISVLPVVNDPKPGYPAAGLRIISADLIGNTYFIQAENIPGTSSDLNIYCNGMIPGNIKNGKLVRSDGKILMVHVNFDQGQSGYVRKTVAIELARQ